MNKLEKQEFGQSHDHWLSWVTERSIRKNTMRKPAFDATKDVTEKDIARKRYINLVDDAALDTAHLIVGLEKQKRRKEMKRKLDRMCIKALFIVGGAMWLTSGIYTIYYFLFK